MGDVVRFPQGDMAGRPLSPSDLAALRAMGVEPLPVSPPQRP
jgi:hypothetical protein